MPDRKKVIKEFKEICEYTMRPHESQVLNDILALLKEQEAVESMEDMGNWELSANAIQSITEALQKMFPEVSKADEAFEELGRLALLQRCYRKAIRWNEKNRRRRLKGLPEKSCPYPNRMKKENGQSRDDEKAVSGNDSDNNNGCASRILL